MDLRFAFRMLAKTPLVTAVAVLTLALGIGANSAVFSVVHSVLLKRLPFLEPDRLVAINHQGSLGFNGFSRTTFHDAASSLRAFSAVAQYHPVTTNYSAGGVAEHVAAAEVTANFLATLGVSPVVGRGFLDSEDEPGHDRVALISYRLWRQSFAGNPLVIGHTVLLAGRPFTVIGVVPQEMTFPAGAEAWTPTVFDADGSIGDAGAILISVFARLRPGVVVAVAQQELRARARQLTPALSADELPSVSTVSSELTASIRPSIIMLALAVALVLLVACANLANLMSARAVQRQAEFAIRRALGSSASRLIRQQLTESLLLAVLGCIAGLAIAWSGVRLLPLIAPVSLAHFSRPSLDWSVVGFTIVVALASGALFGLAPAWMASRQDPAVALSSSSARGTAGHRKLRYLLVAGETAIAVVLLSNAGLLVRSVQNLSRTQLGFDEHNLLTFSIVLRGDHYRANDGKNWNAAALSAFYSEGLQRLKELPGVVSVSAVSAAPLDRRPDMLLPVSISGQQSPMVSAFPRFIAPDYFHTLGIPIVEGRDFSANDSESREHVAIISRDIAEKLWPGQNSLGRKVHILLFNDFTVVGVVPGLQDKGPRVAGFAQAYLPVTQVNWTSMSFIVRTVSDPTMLATSVRSVIQRLDPTLPIFDIATMQDRRAQSESLERFEVVLLSLFSGITLLLAALGLYGVLVFSVGQRTKEIGIRMALGANPVKVVLMILREAGLSVLIGLAIGIPGAIMLGKTLGTVLFNVTDHDPLTLVTVSFVIAAVALSAAQHPAARAASVDPVIALRQE